MSKQRNAASLTREEREALRQLRTSHRRQAEEARLKRAFTRAVLDLQASLNQITRTHGES